MNKKQQLPTDTTPGKATRLVVRIELLGVEPPIWRQLAIDPQLNLYQVNACIQAAFAWENSHLHEFATYKAGSRQATARFVPPFDELDMDGTDEETVTLGEVLVRRGSKLSYTYDFGDSWEHRITREESLPATEGQPAVVCLDGSRAAPPDDCGGPWNYQFLVEAGQDPEHPDYEDAREQFEWLFGEEEFDPERFDLDAVNDRLVTAMSTGFQAWWPDEAESWDEGE